MMKVTLNSASKDRWRHGTSTWSCMAPKIAIAIVSLVSLAACKNGPTVNLSTSEPLKVDPLKVDLNMRVDVYQHADPTLQKKAAVAQPTGTEDVQTRLRNRMGE